MWGWPYNGLVAGHRGLAVCLELVGLELLAASTSIVNKQFIKTVSFFQLSESRESIDYVFGVIQVHGVGGRRACGGSLRHGGCAGA